MIAEYDVCIVGLGPVGTVSGACFAKQGFNVIGVDINEDRVNNLTAGKAPFVEPDLDEIVAEVVEQNKFSATTDLKCAAQNSEIIMIAVGTPTADSGPDLSYVKSVAKSLGEAFAQKTTGKPIVVIRSTVPPGTMEDVVVPIIEKESGLKAGEDFFVASNPEFLREGSAIDDFFNTSRIVVGANNEEAAGRIFELYKDVSGERMAVPIKTAEFAKYVDNSWHALKIAFANEIARVAVGFGGDPKKTAEVFLADDKLNISGHYLRPGAPFGGSCLPKDTRGLCWLAGQYEVKIPTISHIMESNESRIDEIVQLVMSSKPKKVGILGLAFKAGVDDLRESPALYVAEKLREQGVEVLAHDISYNVGDKVKLPSGAAELTINEFDTVKQDADMLVKFHNIKVYNSGLGDKPVFDVNNPNYRSFKTSRQSNAA